MGIAARPEPSRRPFVGLILFALLLRAAIPAGMMLAPAEAGLPRIIPCLGAAPLAVGPHHGRGHHSSDEHRSAPAPAPCPFAVLLFPAVPQAPLLPAAAAIAEPPLPAPPSAWRVPEEDFASWRPPATGPPASS